MCLKFTEAETERLTFSFLWLPMPPYGSFWLGTLVAWDFGSMGLWEHVTLGARDFGSMGFGSTGLLEHMTLGVSDFESM